jgi:Subtilisin-like serine proteases
MNERHKMKIKNTIHEKYAVKTAVPILAAAAFAAVLAGCPTGFVQTGSGGTAGAFSGGGAHSFGAEWIAEQQEGRGKDEAVNEGYSIIKAADFVTADVFTALNAQAEARQDLHDGYVYFLVKSHGDAAQFRAAVRKLNGILYAQPDYRYDAPKAIQSDEKPPYRTPKVRASVHPGALKPFGTGDGNVNEDPKADLADWGLTAAHALEAFKAYDASDAVHPVLTAIVDSGVNSLHEDFYDKDGSIILYAKSSLKRGSDVICDPLEPVPISDNWDDVGHGSHCAGTIAAVGNNGKGICGVSHANTKLIAYRGLSRTGGSSYSVYSCLGDLAEIITELRKEPASRNKSVFTGLPADVQNYPKLTQKTVPVNISLGGYSIHPYEVEMMNKALAAGILPVIAMANDGKTVASYPAALQGVLAVGATSMDDTKAPFSNGGSWISVCAPGESIYSCYNNGTDWSNTLSPALRESYTWMSGTSMATPFVTGTITYLLSMNPDMSPYQIKTLLENTADKIDRGSPYGRYDARGFSKWYGYGRVNVLKAAQAIKNGSVPAQGQTYSEKAVIITVKKGGAVQKNKTVWLYEKQSGLCAAAGMTDEKNGTIRFYGLKTGTEYEVGINDNGTYKTKPITAPADSDIYIDFELNK